MLGDTKSVNDYGRARRLQLSPVTRDRTATLLAWALSVYLPRSKFGLASWPANCIQRSPRRIYGPTLSLRVTNSLYAPEGAFRRMGR